MTHRAVRSVTVFDGLPITLENWGPTGLVALAVILVLLGGLVPRRTHNERVQDKDLQITYLQTALDKRDEQVQALLDGDSVIIQLLESIRQEAERRRE